MDTLLPTTYTEEEALKLISDLHSTLIQQSLTVSVAESCTGGLLGKMLTDTGGSSAFFLGGAITYSNELKTSLLGVKEDTLKQFGAVSAETAHEMAHGAKERFDSDFSLSITGVAGPDGGSEEKPVGTFFVGLGSKENITTEKFHHEGTRGSIRKYAALTAIDLLWEKVRD